MLWRNDAYLAAKAGQPGYQAQPDKRSARRQPMSRGARLAVVLVAAVLILAPWVQALAEWGGGGQR